MDRREFLVAVTATGAALAVSAPLETVAALVTRVEEKQFMVAAWRGHFYVACDWRGPYSQDEAKWSMTSRESGENNWYPDGDRYPDRTIGKLDEVGRKILLDSFGVDAVADEYPLEKIAVTSPRELILRRRELEAANGLPHHGVSCLRCGGGNFPAEEAA